MYHVLEEMGKWVWKCQFIAISWQALSNHFGTQRTCEKPRNEFYAVSSKGQYENDNCHNQFWKKKLR